LNFQNAINKTQWSAEEQVAVLLTYIERQGSEEAFHHYLEEASEDPGEKMEEWIRRIQASIDQVSSLDMPRLEQSAMGADEASYFYAMASAIVEPDNSGEDYFDFVDDAEAWPSFIKQNFGEDWGRVAVLVKEYGY